MKHSLHNSLFWFNKLSLKNYAPIFCIFFHTPIKLKEGSWFPFCLSVIPSVHRGWMYGSQPHIVQYPPSLPTPSISSHIQTCSICSPYCQKVGSYHLIDMPSCVHIFLKPANEVAKVMFSQVSVCHSVQVVQSAQAGVQVHILPEWFLITFHNKNIWLFIFPSDQDICCIIG